VSSAGSRARSRSTMTITWRRVGLASGIAG
jgi:hypothetical protein